MTNLIKIDFKHKSKIIENTNKEDLVLKKAEKTFSRRLEKLNKNNPKIVYSKRIHFEGFSVYHEMDNNKPIYTLVKFYPKSKWLTNLTENLKGRHVSGDTFEDTINYPLFEDEILHLYV